MNSLNGQIVTTVLMGVTLVASLSCTKITPESPPTTNPSPHVTQSTGQFPINDEKVLDNGKVPASGLTNQTNIDPEGMEPGQVCVINTNMAEAKALDQFASVHGYAKKKRRVLESLGFVMSIFQVPPGGRVTQGIRELSEAFPSQVIDANHHYHLQGFENEVDARRYGQQLVGWTKKAGSCGGEHVRIGMVDTTVNKVATFVQPSSIRTQSFLSDGNPEAPSQHGTAVAMQLVGNSPQMGSGLLPNATLLVAETFREVHPGQIEATTWSIVRALDWLVKENVQVINLSLGGPPNALLTFAIERTLNHNIPLVAAAGNTGPLGHPMYPAAQERVIAVTAIDAKLTPYHYASRGSHIAFSAPGVDIWVPTGKESGIFKSGTSFATPFVTTAVAAIKLANPQSTPEEITQYLTNSALDLGSPGKDDIFGWGLIQIPHECSTLSSPNPPKAGAAQVPSTYPQDARPAHGQGESTP